MIAETICCSQLYLTSQIRIFPIAGIQLISDEWMKLLLKPTSTGFHVPPTWHSLCYHNIYIYIQKILLNEIYIYTCKHIYLQKRFLNYTHIPTHIHTHRNSRLTKILSGIAVWKYKLYLRVSVCVRMCVYK